MGNKCETNLEKKNRRLKITMTVYQDVNEKRDDNKKFGNPCVQEIDEHLQKTSRVGFLGDRGHESQERSQRGDGCVYVFGLLDRRLHFHEFLLDIHLLPHEDSDKSREESHLINKVNCKSHSCVETEQLNDRHVREETRGKTGNICKNRNIDNMELKGQPVTDVTVTEAPEIATDCPNLTSKDSPFLKVYI